ncbi:hypothetical protein A7A08_02140 [Methyloligella halotolerans]|uniref:Uncharacterized protein n=1 Tax=Methyloligella halotolerans TaxID=1177755 RepID=A0A1E2RXA3_9HYPH|nr:hypothetical protein [Methyloligella halotolerans]ODA66843.1 hypothetical protein A7A08_02140 [Methyloligella halotolerans]
MAVQVTPPTKNMLYFAIALGVIALLLYIIGVLGFVDGGFGFIGHFAFWISMAALASLIAAVTMKGV